MRSLPQKNGNIYVVQFETGTNINLLPLAAGQLYSRLKREERFLKEHSLSLQEIVFKRPGHPRDFFTEVQDIALIGFSSFLWNVNVTLRVAREVRKRFKNAVIILGGPSIPKEKELVEPFLRLHPYVDLICLGEGEDVFWDICRRHAQGEGFAGTPGVIFHDRKTGAISRNDVQPLPAMELIASPYLDGTFDSFFRKYTDHFSGIVLETNRGCPYQCSFCTWGNLASHKIRYKSMDLIAQEIDWVGRHGIRYIAMADSNFGLNQRDIEITRMFAACKKKYGVPNFISVSWAKNSAEKILEISDILQKSGIGFRVTLSLQSLNPEVLRAINRENIKLSSFLDIKKAYRRKKVYSYTELILGLPMETYESLLDGVERSLSDSVFDQLYVYPLFLFPNTKMSSIESRKAFSITGKTITNRYTKSKDRTTIKEQVEVLVSHSTMSRERWVDSFVMVYFVLALHDERLAFFILSYLRKNFSIKVFDLAVLAKELFYQDPRSAVGKAFRRLEKTAQGVQEKGRSHLIEPKGFGGIPYDPPNAIFLELLMDRDRFFADMLHLLERYFVQKGVSFDHRVIKDLVDFQKMVMAHPDGPVTGRVALTYDWIRYFEYTFQMDEMPLSPLTRELNVVDTHPCQGSREEFLKTHYDIRGVPVFNRIVDAGGKTVFPLLAEVETEGEGQG